MTDSEIVKALECCTTKTHTCLECPYKDFGQCEYQVMNDTLDLINRLQAENEDYKALYEGVKTEHIETIKAIKHYKAEAYKEFAERLKKLTSNKFWDGNKMHELKVPFVGVDEIDNILKELIGE